MDLGLELSESFDRSVLITTYIDESLSHKSPSPSVPFHLSWAVQLQQCDLNQAAIVQNVEGEVSTCTEGYCLDYAVHSTWITVEVKHNH